ncbi:MAG TPA: SGNH/GDSL hydrolase family protein [Sporichthyaceae bacterium]
MRNSRRSALRAALLTAAVGVVVVAATQPFAAAGSTAAAPTPGAATVDVVGFGDSVPLGKHCGGCGDLFTLYAKRITPAGQTPTVVNLAKGNTTSKDALKTLKKSSSEAAVKKATTVLIYTGADDFKNAFTAVSHGGSAKKHYKPVEKSVEANVESMIGLIHSLNPAAHVAVLDYWAAMEDGKVAKHDYTKAELKAGTEATDYLNKGLAAAAKHSHATYVSTYTLFKGKHGDKDPTKYLADDGNHPNAAGMKAITAALVAALPAA